MQSPHQLVYEKVSRLVRERLARAPGHVGERRHAEVVHGRAAFVEAVPEPAGPIGPLARGVLRDPFPGRHALAHAADRVDQHQIVRRPRPIPQRSELLHPALEGEARNIGGLGVKRGRRWDVVGGGRGRGRLWWRRLIEKAAKQTQGLHDFDLKVFDRFELGVNPVLLRERRESSELRGRDIIFRMNRAAVHRMLRMHYEHADRQAALDRAAKLKLGQRQVYRGSGRG